MLRKFLLILLFFFTLIPNAYSVGIGAFIKEIKFYPNLNENIEAFVINNVGSDIRVKLDARGALSEYVTFNEDEVDITSGGKYFFTFNLKLPEEIPPGRNELYIGATDITPPPPGSGGIRAVTSAYKAFIIEAPYPGKYIEAGFTAQDAELDGAVIFNVNLVSKGKEVISNIDGVIEIFNQDNKIAVLTLDPIMGIKPEESKTIQAEWDSRGNKIGEYTAKAAINYDGRQLTLDAKFRIGALLVKIINCTKEFYKDEINKFDIEIESFWNMEISNVYGEIDINNQKIKTLEANLAPWSKTKITAYLDTTSLDLGEHTASIKAYYADKSAEEVARIIVLPKKEKVIELPSKIPSTKILLIAIIILLVIGNAVLILHFLKNEKNSKKAKKK